MEYGERFLREGMKGPDVRELQIRLAGFSGKLPDGDFGPGTKKSVEQFQKDYMKISPTGEVDKTTYESIDAFMAEYPIDFAKLKCVCGKCGGFGKGRYEKEYNDTPKVEKHHKYEYPGIHRVLLFTVRALRFYSPHALKVTSCYRCWYDNEQHDRKTTNHMGKAIDLDTDGAKETDAKRANEVRKVAVDKCNCTDGWVAGKKGLEPASIAPTWVHMDVREIGSEYLGAEYFVKDEAALNNKKPITAKGFEEAPADKPPTPKPAEPTKTTTSTQTTGQFAGFGEKLKWVKPKRAVSKIFLHCSASDNANHDNVETMDTWHKERSWPGIGYHLFIKKDGTVLHGRNLEYIPTAQAGHNTGSIAICLHGLAKDKFTEAQYKAVRGLARTLHDAYDGKLTFHGHCEVSTKSCPVFDYKKVLELDATGKLGKDVKGDAKGPTDPTTPSNPSTNPTTPSNPSTTPTNPSTPSTGGGGTQAAVDYKNLTLYADVRNRLQSSEAKDGNLSYRDVVVSGAETKVRELFRDVLAPYAKKTLRDFPNQDERLKIIARVVEAHEGFVDHMYVDSRGLLTVGIGTMIDAENAAMIDDLPFTLGGKAATSAQRQTDKKACKAVYDRNSSSPPLYTAYTGVTKCRLSHEASRTQCQKMLKAFEDALLKFPNNAAQLKAKKDDIPFFAWVCMVDMCYGLSTRRFTEEWPSCLKAIANGNWQEAAKQSWTKGVSAVTQALRHHLLRDAALARAGTGTVEVVNTGGGTPTNIEKPAETYVPLLGDVVLPVDLGDGIQVTEASLAKAYKHTEKDHAGGYFPLGVNTVWHGGVHFHVDKQAPVRAIADGEIVAVRLAPKGADAIKAYGSRNFILVRHALLGRALETLANKGDVFDDNKVYPFFSLYMHLDPQPLEKGNPKLADVRWLRTAGAGGKSISGSVGEGATNRTADVKAVQELLIAHGADLGSAGADGVCGSKTKTAITAFQEPLVKQKILSTADGRVDVGGNTWKQLNQGAGAPAGSDFDAALVKKLAAGEFAEVRRPIRAGEVLWVAGEQGNVANRAPVVHVEIFSEANLFPHFSAVEDKDEDFTIDCKPLIDMVDQDLMGDKADLTAAELSGFYRSDKSQKVRKFACRFTTEWGANLDKALERLEGRFDTWGLRDALEPYTWYTDAEISRLKLPPKLSWHYNPVAFIHELAHAGVKTSPVDGQPPPILEGEGAVAGVVPFFCQADDKWASIKLNDKVGSQSIKQAGCAISSIAMVLAYFGRDVNPKHLDAFLDAKGGYDENNCVYWGTAFAYRPWKQGDPSGDDAWSSKATTGPAISHVLNSVRLNGDKPGGGKYTEADLKVALDAQLARGIPTVIQVRSAHYVVVFGRNEQGGYVINDPGKSKGQGVVLTDKITQIIQYDVDGPIKPLTQNLPDYEPWTTKALLAELGKAKSPAREAILEVLCNRSANVHFQVIESQEWDGDEIYVEMSSGKGTSISTTVSLEDGESGTVAVPLAGVLPFDGPLTVKVYENDPGLDDLITTFTWKPPYDRLFVDGKGDGAHYQITCMFEASAETPPKAPDYKGMKSAQIVAVLNDPKQAANHWAARDELAKREVVVKVHVVDTEDTFGADHVFVELNSNGRKTLTKPVPLEEGQEHTFKIPLRDLMPFSGSILLRIYDEDTIDDDLIIEDVWMPPYSPLVIGKSQRLASQKASSAEYWVTMHFADAPPATQSASSSSASSSSSSSASSSSSSSSSSGSGATTSVKGLGPPYTTTVKDGVEYLSPNFTHPEFIRSYKATQLKIDNSMTAEHKTAAVHLCRDIMEPIRAHFGKSISVGSGYRSKALNDKTNGASATSQHMKGEAADFGVKATANLDVYNWVAFTSDLDFDQIIYEHGPDGWIHISYQDPARTSKPNRNQIVIATDVHITPKDRPEDLAYGPKYKNGSYATATTYTHHRRCGCATCTKAKPATTGTRKFPPRP